MRKSKLEKRIDILRILIHGPMKSRNLMHKTELSQNDLKQHLDFLIQQNLVEEQNLGKDAIFYVITGRGVRVLNIVAPMISEARKSQALLH
jgi:predicted transcriptional regulator